MWRHLACFLLLLLAALPVPAAAKAISGADVGILGQSLALIDQGSAADARALAKQAKDPLIYDLVVFFDISRKDAVPSFVDVAGHLAAHPNWPRRTLLELKAEAFFPAGMAPEDVAAWFADHPAQTGLGALLEVDALMALGRSDQAKTKADRALADPAADRCAGGGLPRPLRRLALHRRPCRAGQRAARPGAEQGGRGSRDTCRRRLPGAGRGADRAAGQQEERDRSGRRAAKAGPH